MKRIAVFPGSFDPFTVGHQNIVLRAMLMFDEIIVAIGENSQKKYMLSLEKRKAIIADAFKGVEQVKVESYSGLTVDYCNAEEAKFILRGLRNSRDLDFEQPIAQMNKKLDDSIETVFLVNAPEFSAINSSIVREIYLNGGDVSDFLPNGIKLEE
ncbi:MAG: pantetheine-phosphate adenylyltransferase [Flavobacteriales bacterium]|jgi:pantetheine-phosphate adenylyltransferase|tara:strand:+ start:336 stop:800 length:465 start_codon:yes stop_codon:yes gene_type:complete